MDGVGDALLAGAGLALDQHGRVALREPVDEVEHVAHRRAAADQAVQARLVPQRDRHAVVERVEHDRALADLDGRAGGDEAVDDADAADVRAVRRAEVADAVAVGLEPELGVEPRHLRIGEVQVGAGAADHDRRLRELDDLADVGAGDDLEPAAAHVDRAGEALERGDPGGSLEVMTVGHVFVRTYHAHRLAPVEASTIRTRPLAVSRTSSGFSLLSSMSASTTAKLSGGS